MTQPSKVETVFYQARELPPEQRGEYLAVACESDAALRKQVDRLLAAETRANEGSFLRERPEPLVAAAGRESIGGYQLKRQIGQGAQASVFLAHDGKLDRDVALKVLRVPFPTIDLAGAKRFRREAAFTANIQHPGICEIYDTGEADGFAWIAMQYVPGRTLAEVLVSQSGRGPVRFSEGAWGDSEDIAAGASGAKETSRREFMDAVLFIERAARALHVAHERGLVHRDVKPGNLMVTGGGEPVILDFGIARTNDGEDGFALTRTNDVLGTPYYMSPEQLRAEHGEIDRRADVYSLGVTLYECLTRERPFEAVSVDSLYQQILSANPRPPRRFNYSIPRDLEVVVMTAMDGMRSRRYVSALEFAEDLRRVREQEPVRARAISRWGRAKRWARRHPATAASTAGVTLALTIGLGTSLHFLNGANEALAREVAVRRASYDALSRAVAFQDFRGQHTWMHPQLHGQAVAMIDADVPGFRQVVDEIKARHPRWRGKARHETGQALMEVLDRLSPAARLCASDWLHVEARNLMAAVGSDSEEAFREAGIRFAKESLRVLEEAKHPLSDPRVVRARVLLLDGLLEAGRALDAERLAQRYLAAEDQMGTTRDSARFALYESRLGAALHGRGDMDAASEVLERSCPIVVGEYPGTWLAIGAQASWLSLCDQADDPSEGMLAAREKLRGELCMSLAMTAPGVVLKLTHWSRRSLRLGLGSGREGLWDWFDHTIRVGQAELATPEVDRMLARLSALRQEHGIERGDPVLAVLAIALGSTGNHQAAEHGWNHGMPERLFQVAVALTSERGGGSQDVPGEETSAGAITMMSLLGLVHIHQGKLESAEQELRSAVDAAPTQSRIRDVTSGLLGVCLTRRGQHEEAEELLGRAYRSNLQWLGAADVNTGGSINNLVVLYEAWGRPEEAELWRRRAQAAKEN